MGPFKILKLDEWFDLSRRENYRLKSEEEKSLRYQTQVTTTKSSSESRP